MKKSLGASAIFSAGMLFSAYVGGPQKAESAYEMITLTPSQVSVLSKDMGISGKKPRDTEAVIWQGEGGSIQVLYRSQSRPFIRRDTKMIRRDGKANYRGESFMKSD